MEARNLIIAAVVTATIMTLIILALVGIFKYYPEFYGLQPNRKSTLEAEKKIVYVEPSIQLSSQEFDEMQNRILKIDVLREIKKKNESNIKLLKDSLKSIGKSFEKERITAKQMKDSITKRNEHSLVLLDSITRLNDLITNRTKQLKLCEKKAKDMESIMEVKLDSLEKKNFQMFAKIYDNAGPAVVARILERIDERDAAIILKNMQKRKAGKVLDAMNPEQSAAILLLGIVK